MESVRTCPQADRRWHKHPRMRSLSSCSYRRRLDGYRLYPDGFFFSSPSLFLPTSNLHVELSPLLISIALSHFAVPSAWTGAVDAWTGRQLIEMPVVFTALFGSHMRYVNYIVISHSHFLRIIKRACGAWERRFTCQHQKHIWILHQATLRMGEREKA